MTGTTGSDGAGSSASGAGPIGDVQWYIARDGQQHGPLSDAEMRLFVEGAHLRPTDLIWRPGFSEWRPALQVFPPRPQVPVDPPLPRSAPASTASSGPQPQAQQPNPQPQTQTQQTPAAPKANDAGRMAAGMSSAGRQQSTARPTAAAQPGPAGPQPYQQSDPRTQPGTRSQAPHTADMTSAGRPQTGPATMGPAASTAGTAVTRSSAEYADEDEYEPPRRSRAKTLVLATVLIASIGASGWFIANNKDSLMQMLGAGSGGARQDAKVPVIKSEPAVTASLQKPKAAVTAPAAPPPVPEPTDADIATIDQVLQKRQLWSYLKAQFPDWYGERIKEAARLAVQKKPDREVTKLLVEGMVAHRRKNADLALKASTERHRAIAAAFLDNLQALSGRSADTCYRFISQGEASPVIVDILNDPAAAPTVEAQVLRIFEAITEGKGQPAAHERPKKEDYDVLAAQLGKLGWSQADLQMFADPKALSAAPPARVCQMVRDWFKAHVEITDGAVQERLLFETLRPVVAG